MESNGDASGLGLVGSVGLFLMICLVAGTPLAANRTGPGSDWAVRGKAARAAVFRETRTIANDLVRVTVSLETAGEQARFVVDGMTDLQTGLDLDLSASPIWQVMLASAGTPPPGVAVPADAALGDGPAFVPSGRLRWGPSTRDTLVLQWSGLEVPGGQTLDVEVSIGLDASGGLARWNMKAGSSEGKEMIVSTAFPLLELPGIGDRHEDDVLLHPALGGSLIRDPISCGSAIKEFVAATGDPRPQLMYPGVLVSQFMTLYDGDLGLYLAAEDPEGAMKGLVYSLTGNGIRLWFRNYNTTPDPGDRLAMAVALRHFDLAALGYPIVVGFHHGDWMTAADLYRQWAFGEAAPFLARGTIAERRDIGGRVRDLSLLVHYGFGFLDTPVELDEDEARLAAAIDFFRGNEPGLAVAVNLLGVIDGRENSDVPRESWYGTVGSPELHGELKAGVPELIGWLMDGYGVPAGHNRDTGGWLVRSGMVEEQLYDRDDALHRAVVRHWNGDPAFQLLTRRLLCAGSQWQAARRLTINTNTVLDSRGPGGTGPGFQFLLQTGQGTNPKPCYAPLLGDDPAGDHWHPPGGGTWWYERFAGFVAGLRSVFGDRAPWYVVIPEQDSEQLMGMTGMGLLAGKARQYPFSDDGATQVGGEDLPCSQPVPLLMYLYHDRVLQGSRAVFLSTYIEAFGSRYAPDGSTVPHPNYYRAMAALAGQILTLRLRSQVLSALEDGSIDGPFAGGLCPAAREDWEFLRLLAETRHRNLEYLAWGRMLRPPTVQADEIELEAYRGGALHTYPVGAVIASAFRAPDGTVGLFAANHTRQSREYTLSFDPARYGLGPGSSCVLKRIGPDGSTMVIGRVSGDGAYTSPVMSLPPLSIHAFVLAPAAPPPRRPAGRATAAPPSAIPAKAPQVASPCHLGRSGPKGREVEGSSGPSWDVPAEMTRHAAP